MVKVGAAEKDRFGGKNNASIFFLKRKKR